MKNRDAIVTMIGRAEQEITAHWQAKRKHPYWDTGHKAKAKRAILMAREMLLEASKELDKEARRD